MYNTMKHAHDIHDGVAHHERTLCTSLDNKSHPAVAFLKMLPKLSCRLFAPKKCAECGTTIDGHTKPGDHAMISTTDQATADMHAAAHHSRRLQATTGPV